MKTLEAALLLLQRINGLVENYAMALKRNQPTGPFLMNIRRSLPTLAENLKSQFGLIAEQIVGINLAASRGASEGDPGARPSRGRGADQTGDRNRDHADEGQARGGGREEARGGIGDR